MDGKYGSKQITNQSTILALFALPIRTHTKKNPNLKLKEHMFWHSI
jgi:hypothetical protein